MIKNSAIWKFLNKKSLAKNKSIIAHAEQVREQFMSDTILVGFGVAGRKIFEELQRRQITPVVIELNINTINELNSKSIPAVFGDATRIDTLTRAGLKNATRMFITLPDESKVVDVVSETMKINEKVKIYARIRYNGSKEIMKGMGVFAVFAEEDAVALAMVEELKNEAARSEMDDLL